jgi:aryl-alcohol dehydrogenase-like predicted oxidoreductase
MRYTLLGRTGMRVSRICLGTGPFGVAPLEEDAIRLVHHALDIGVNFIDTANSYGNFTRLDRAGAPSASERSSAEVIVGRALRGRRDDVVLATKVHEVVGTGVLDVGLSRRHMVQQVERSLRALQTDYIDLYHLHGPDRDTPIEQTLKTMDDLVRQGKVRYFGLSNFSAWRTADTIGTARLLGCELPVVHQIGYNLVQRNAEQDVIPACEHYGLSVSTYGSLNGGLLAGTHVLQRPIVGLQRFREDKSKPVPFAEAEVEAATKLEGLASEWGHAPAHLALAWLMSRKVHATAIIGPETIAELDASAPAADLDLDAAQLAQLDALLPPAQTFEARYDAALAAQTAQLGRPKQEPRA